MSSWGCCPHPAKGCAACSMRRAPAALRGGGCVRPQAGGLDRRSSGPCMAERKAGETAQPLTQGTAPRYFCESRVGGQRRACDSSVQRVTS